MIEKIEEFLEKFSKGRKAIVAEGGSLHGDRIEDRFDLQNTIFYLASKLSRINFVSYDYNKELLLSCKLIAKGFKLKNLEFILGG